MAAAAQIEINGVVYTPMPVPAAAAEHDEEEEQYSESESTAWSSYTVGAAHIVDEDLALMVSLLENPPPAITIQDADSSDSWRFEELDSEEEHALTTNEVTVCHVGAADWFLDSGAAMHCTPDKEDLVDIRAIRPVPIRGISGARIFATAMGTLEIALRGGKRITIPGVLVVPGASIRLISVGRLADDGLKTLFEDSRTALILAGRTVAATASCAGRGLYALDTTIRPKALNTSHTAAVAVGLDVWHSRLGHPGNTYVEALARSDAVRGMHLDLSTLPPVCEPCIQGKQKHTPVPKRREGGRSDAFLRLVFVDLAGSPTRVATPNGHHYRLTIVDDHSDFNWSRLARAKDQCHNLMIEWVLMMEREGHRVEVIQIDNGELKSERFAAWCAARGIVLCFTAPYSSAQNGRVERKHHTISSRARAARIAADCPDKLWGEFELAVSYLDNFLPRKLSKLSPWVARYRKPADVSHLRELGCKAFMLIQPQQQRSKIRAQSTETVLVGYDLRSKAYRLYNRKNGAVYTSRDVTFVESWQLSRCSYKPGVIVGHPVATDAPHADGWAKPTVPSPVSDPSLSLPHALSPDSALPSSCPDLFPSVDSDTSIDSKATTPAPSPLNSDLIPSPSTESATPLPADVDSTPHVPITLPYDDTSPPDQVPPLRRSKRVADRLATTIQDGRRYAWKQRKRKRIANPDVYAATLANASPDEVITMLAAAIADEKVLVAQLFGELLDTDLVDLAYALESEDDCPDQEEPGSMKEALAGKDRTKWRNALLTELQSIADLGVYELVDRRDVPAGRRILTGKPVFKIKRDENGDPIRWKARWVVKGFLQVFGVDYNETTSPTARLETFRILCHIMAAEDLALRQFDVQTAFLHGELPKDERVYMKQPPGFEDPEKPDHVWMLVKALYGMKQAGRVWNQTLNKALTEDFGFVRVSNEHCLYVRHDPGGSFSIASIHVDDTLAIGSSEEELNRLQRDLESRWKITVADGSFSLGIHLERDRPGAWFTSRRLRLSTALLRSSVSSTPPMFTHPWTQASSCPLRTAHRPPKRRRIWRTSRTASSLDRCSTSPKPPAPTSSTLWVALRSSWQIQVASTGMPRSESYAT
jgi:hypothetical protein